MFRSTLTGVLIAIALCPLVSAYALDSDDEELLQKFHIPTEGPALLDFFRARSTDETQNKDLKRLIRQLGDDSFDEREAASKKLIALGAPARAALLLAVNDPDLEIVRRAKKCLRIIEEATPTSQSLAAAIRVLAEKQESKAVEVLLGYLPFADDEEVSAEVGRALQTLAVRDGKIDSALTGALKDKLPVRRAVAGAALAHARASEALPAVRKLLNDSDISVRLQLVLGLVAIGDKDAVSQMIGLLTDPGLSLRQAEKIETYLARLGELKSPLTPLGVEADARKKYHDDWLAWWKAEGSDLTEAEIEGAARPKGYTLVVLLDLGVVIDLDQKNRPRWQFRGLELPLDVQMLTGERVLVAEHKANRVTERNRKGEILWEKEVDTPLVAQRLPSGNTFVASAIRMVELDREGKEVFGRGPKDGELIMKAVKLGDGEIAYVAQAGLRGPTSFVRLNANGTEIQRFPVAMRTSGGRLEVLSNGNVLIPEMERNRVVEYGKQGQVVWEGQALEPIAAVRLANGNTLVTSYTEGQAVEIDRQNKRVWEYKNVYRVTRAFRR